MGRGCRHSPGPSGGDGAVRPAGRVSRTPREWIDHQQQERERILGQLLRELRHARETGAEWYRWIRDGQPQLSEAEYQAVGVRGGRRGRTERGGASA